MSIKNPYLQKVYQQVCQRDANEPEFLNAVMEVLSTLEPVIEKHPEYEAAGPVSYTHLDVYKRQVSALRT